MRAQYPASVEAALKDGPTPPLEDFALAVKIDGNLVWRLDTGHLVNLLEEALERLRLDR